MKLLVGIPSFANPHPKFSMDSGWPLMYHIGRRHPEIEECVLHRDGRTYRHMAREGICKAAVDLKMDYVLMLDDDQVFSPKDFDAVWEERAEDRIIGGLYFHRNIPTGPCVFKGSPDGSDMLEELPKEMLFPADIVGFGFCLFPVSALNKLNRPWFYLNQGHGEDVAFGFRCQQAGIKLLVHQGTNIGHIGEPVVVGWKEWREQGERAENSPTKLVALSGGNGGSTGTPSGSGSGDGTSEASPNSNKREIQELVPGAKR